MMGIIKYEDINLNITIFDDWHMNIGNYRVTFTSKIGKTLLSINVFRGWTKLFAAKLHSTSNINSKCWESPNTNALHVLG